MEKRKIIITNILILIISLAPTLIAPSRICEYNLPKVIFLLSCGLLLLVLILSSYKNLKIDKKDILILLFIGLIYLSTIFSSNLKISIFGSDNRYEGLLMFITYICIYLCSKKFFTLKNKHIFFNIIFYITLFIGLLGIAQGYFDFIELKPIFNKGICATFGHSNFFGSYISIVLPIAITYFIIKGSKKTFCLSCIIFFNMIASGTRSAWVAFVVISFLQIIFLLKQKNKSYYKRFFILFISFVLIFIYLFSGFQISDIINKETAVSKNVAQTITKKQVEQIKTEIKIAKDEGINRKMGSSRIWIWTATLKLIQQKPILGCGTDNLKYGLLLYVTDDAIEFIYERNEIIDKAHNEYLQIAATVGIPAVIVYLIFISSILLPKMKQMLKNKTYLIIALCIISYLVQAFFNISTIGVAPLFWMILGLADNKELIEKLDKELN